MIERLPPTHQDGSYSIGLWRRVEHSWRSADESKDKGQHAGSMNRRVDAIGLTDS